MNKILKTFVFVTLIALILVVGIDAADVGNSGSSGGFSSSSSSSSSYSSGGDGSGLFYIFYLIPYPWNYIIVTALIILTAYSKIKAEKNNVKQTGANYELALQSRNNDIIRSLIRRDKFFSKYEFLTYARHVIIEIEEAIEAKKYSHLHLFADKEFINKIVTDQKNEVYDGQEIVDVTISDYYIDDTHEYLVVEAVTSELRKSRNFKRDLYATQIIFKRDITATTNKNHGLSVTNCPNCGAAASIDEQAICSFCQADINTSKYSFIVTKLTNMSVEDTFYYSLYNSGNRLVHYFEDETVNKIKEIDPNFDQIKFEEYAQETFLKVQEAWENRDIKAVRQFESEELYLIHSKQIQEYINKKQVPYINDQKVLDVHLNNYEVDGKAEYLTVYLEANVVLYLMDEETNSIISGSKSKVNHNFYQLRFKRGLGVTTTDNNPLHNCPSCGAPLQISESGKCEYCESLVTSGNYSFVLDSYERIDNFKNVRKTKQKKYASKI